MKYAIYFLLAIPLFGCNSSQSLPGKKLREMRLFEARFDRGKQMDWKLVEKKCYNRREVPISEFYYDENGVIPSQTNYEYDSKGREIKSTERLNGKVIYFCYAFNRTIGKLS
ncbi:hypothetical protein [Fluviicola chungangensis]|uniref:RHS repeat protein n=1 Tax=Fluviicola chungangensis TaxID=2597671 RepID=A0A556N730_9FLAO|nr:hypothetical protein [Fluviicola chungangensis]TSJ47921.1 hypothetical protein FO442_01970 [Fluviicola chungangensis]